MKKSLLAGAAALAAACTVLSAAGSASAAGPTPRGIELGARTGYVLPMGQVDGASGDDLSNVFSGQIPIWIDAGYRASPHIYAGAFFQYGVAFLADKASNTAMCNQGVSCSGNDILVGGNFHYHISPQETFDPWIGVGVGYEWLNFNGSVGSSSVNVQTKGWQFVDFQLGGDIKVSPDFGIGPFVMLSLGQFDSISTSSTNVPNSSNDITNQAMHEWLTIGVRGSYDINVGGSSSASAARLVP
jgi:hypothetical protein